MKNDSNICGLLTISERKGRRYFVWLTQLKFLLGQKVLQLNQGRCNAEKILCF